MTSETKFTPGPWGWEYTGDSKHIIVGQELECGQIGFEIAELDSDDVSEAEGEIVEADARLIASAPALYEALREMTAEYERTLDALGVTEGNSFTRKAQAALASINPGDAASGKGEG